MKINKYKYTKGRGSKRAKVGLNALQQGPKDHTPRTHKLFILQTSHTRGDPGRSQSLDHQSGKTRSEETKRSRKWAPSSPVAFTGMQTCHFHNGDKGSVCSHCKCTNVIHLLLMINEYHKGLTHTNRTLFSQFQTTPHSTICPQFLNHHGLELTLNPNKFTSQGT